MNVRADLYAVMLLSTLFNPPRPVRDKLNHVDFEIATLEQMMTLLSRIDRQYGGALLESQFPSHQLSQYS